MPSPLQVAGNQLCALQPDCSFWRAPAVRFHALLYPNSLFSHLFAEVSHDGLAINASKACLEQDSSGYLGAIQAVAAERCAGRRKLGSNLPGGQQVR